jgi:hypothetical protein
LIVARASELADSIQLQYELQEKLTDELQDEILNRLDIARKNRSSDPFWALANPVFEGILIDVVNGLDADELGPKLKPLLVDYAAERVRAGKGIPAAADNFLSRMIAQLVVLGQDDLRARLKQMVQSALAERAERELPHLLDRNADKTRQMIGSAIRDLDGKGKHTV